MVRFIYFNFEKQILVILFLIKLTAHFHLSKLHNVLVDLSLDINMQLVGLGINEFGL